MSTGILPVRKGRGSRTWGGEVGVLGYPRLMDGGEVTAPNFALWSPEGGRVIGAAPDVEVIEIVLEEKNPARLSGPGARGLIVCTTLPELS